MKDWRINKKFNAPKGSFTTGLIRHKENRSNGSAIGQKFAIIENLARCGASADAGKRSKSIEKVFLWKQAIDSNACHKPPSGG